MWMSGLNISSSGRPLVPLPLPTLSFGVLLVCLCIILCLVSLLPGRLPIIARQRWESHMLHVAPAGLLLSQYLCTHGLAVRGDFGPGGCSPSPWDKHPPTSLQLPSVRPCYLHCPQPASPAPETGCPPFLCPHPCRYGYAGRVVSAWSHAPPCGRTGGVSAESGLLCVSVAHPHLHFQAGAHLRTGCGWTFPCIQLAGVPGTKARNSQPPRRWLDMAPQCPGW